MASVEDSARNGFFRDWHIDKRVSLGHIVTTIAVGAAAFMWIADVDKRVELNAAAILEMKDRQTRTEARQEQALRELKFEIQSGFANLERKLEAMTARIDRQRDGGAP